MYNIHKRWGDLNGYYNDKSKINQVLTLELKTGSRWGLKRDWLDYTTAINLYFNKIRRDQNSIWTFEVTKNLTVDEFLCSNWREGLENVEDGWDWYKVELIPEAQDDFYKLDNSQRLHAAKVTIKLENQGCLPERLFICTLAGYREVKTQKISLRIVFHETVNAIEIIEVIAIGKREVITKFIQFLKNVYKKQMNLF